MQLKPSAFQFAIVWAILSFLTTACGPSANCDDPSTSLLETCGTSTHGGIYYSSGSSSFVRSYRGSSNIRSGFGKTGGGRSGFG